jgi:hypothetical protein
MSMDLGQLTQMTTWLDEEQRSSKSELTRLHQLVEAQQVELEDQARVIQDFERRMSGLQTQTARANSLEVALGQLKEEVVQMIAQADERRQQEAREAERVRSIERDNVSQAINEIRRDLQRLPRLDEENALRKAEQRRMSESLLDFQQSFTSLSQEVENRLRGLSFMEDGRQQDLKRIARLQQESLEALKRIEQHDSRLQRNEDVLQRQERDSNELKALVSQLRTEQREFIEGQLLEAEQRKREMAEWIEALEAQAKKMEGFTARIQEFTESFREDRNVVESIERFQEQIRRDQTQVAELQRLGEDRQKRQLEEWQEENEKRWRKELLGWEHQWAEQGKRNKQAGDRFDEVEARIEQHRAEIDAAWRLLEWQATYQTQESRRWLGEITNKLQERPKKE